MFTVNVNGPSQELAVIPTYIGGGQYAVEYTPLEEEARQCVLLCHLRLRAAVSF